VQIAETHLCVFRPTFVVALEHSEDDMSALLQLLGKDPADVRLRHANQVGTQPAASGHGSQAGAGSEGGGSHSSETPPPAASSTDRSLTAWYPQHLLQLVQTAYREDFAALGYSPNLDCA
jgi:hypothetical protein